MAEKVFNKIEVTNEEKSYGGFFFKMIIFLALIFVRNVFDLSIPSVVFLIVSSIIMLSCDKEEIIAFGICCLPMSPALQHKYIILFAIGIYWFKYTKDIQVNSFVFPLIFMMTWELLHAFEYSFSSNEYLRTFAEMIFCTFLMINVHKKFNQEMLFRLFALCTLVMMTIVLFNLLEETNYNFERIFSGSYRFGKQEIEADSYDITYNPNGLGFICNLAISGLLILIVKNKHKLSDIFFIGLLMFFGFLTMSRSFFVCCAFIFVLFALSRGASISSLLKAMVFMIIIIALVYGIMVNYAPFVLEQIMDRFMEKDISNGRIDLIGFYNQHLLSEYKYMFFGIGVQNMLYKIFTIYNITKITVPHNGIQEIMVIWGLPGVAFFIAYIYCLIKSSLDEAKKHKLAHFIPLLLTLLYVQSGQLVRSGIAMLAFAFCYIALCTNFEEETNEYVEEAV